MPGFSSPVGEHRYRDCRYAELTALLNRSKSDPSMMTAALSDAFGQPAEQQLPADFLAMLIQIDRSKARSGR